MPIVDQALMRANRFALNSLSPTQLEELTKTLEDEGILSEQKELAEESLDKESIYYLENPYHSLDDYTYTATDNSIVSVDEEGKIVANKVGNTVVVVKAKKSNQKELLNVNVVLKGDILLIEDIKLSVTEISLKVGESHNVSYEIVPTGALTDNIRWSSSNTSVAVVDKGVITGKKVGNCVIYVREGNINKEIKVKVLK